MEITKKVQYVLEESSSSSSEEEEEIVYVKRSKDQKKPKKKQGHLPTCGVKGSRVWRKKSSCPNKIQNSHHSP